MIDKEKDLLERVPNMQNSVRAHEAVYLIQDIILEYNMDKKAYTLDGDATDQEQAQFHYSFPLLEVDELSLRIFTNAVASVDDELLSYFGNIDSQRTQRDSPINDGMELLGSLQYDSLDSDCIHFLSKHCLESGKASADMFPAMDIISLVESLNTKEGAADCLSPTRPIVFQEFKFLDVDSSQLYEVFFDMQMADDQGTCDWMFEEDMNFKNFNDLIISSELALVDDTFKSLPIPIISDHGKIRSIDSVAKGILSHLMPHPLSASNLIYMNWNLLEEDKFSPDILSFYQYKFEDLDSQSSDFDWESFGDGKLKVDLVFCDDALDGPKEEEHEELLDMHYTSNCLLMDASSSKLFSNRSPKSGYAEHLAEDNAEKASLLFKAMSQFNDLKFFLNPQKATDEIKRESAVQTHDADAKLQDSCCFLSLDANINKQSLEEFPNAANIENKYNTRLLEVADVVEACCMPMPVPHFAQTMESKQLPGGMASFPDTIIIMNTQNFDKEMIISRRSTYQRLLTMEKEGAQVIERDLDMPVDAIISSSVCLVWYDCRNIIRKATAVDEASSSLPLCIEHIATNVLTRLSFTFSGCILVFEGETSFLSTVMDSSDGLYAAASSLGVDLQLFCSYSPELTDEIILSTILYATKLYRGIYPQMPESETLAEAFLTQFPSVNTLTAHAMLSSGGLLIELFEWPHDRRILAVQQYHVPDESVALFSALSGYGEREDSKSIMTDCSSSVSSGTGSDKCHFKIQSHRKQKTCVHRGQKRDMRVDDVWQSELLNQFSDGLQGSSDVCKRNDYWMSKDIDIVDELKYPSPVKILFFQKKEPDTAGITDPSLIVDENKGLRSAKRDKLLGHAQGNTVTVENNFDCTSASKYETQCKDFNGETIDFDGGALMDMAIPSITKPTDFSPWLFGPGEECTRKSKGARRLSFDKNNHPTFPTAAQINSGTDMRTAGDHRESLHGNNVLHDTVVDHNKVFFEQPNKLLEELLAQKSSGISKEFSFKAQIPHNNGTPLSRAIRSKHPQTGSPWTIEFLNRIREKSRLRQQSLPTDSSTPVSSILGYGIKSNMSRVARRRSPSILEFFKYQGGSTPQKTQQQKKQKQSAQFSSSSKIESTSASILPTWTPIDKRSRQTLSFALNESGNQTKLVWTDGSAHHLSKKFRSQ